KAKETKESKDVYTEFFLTFDNEIITDPIWIKNHTNNQYDIIFQDSENYLFYYSNKGNLYWKKKIDEKIIGDIKQIDTYKNGRLQISFRTENKFYVLDRNGKEVEKLSFKIDSGEINNPVSIFDYEKNRNYRFLFANDNTIKMFDSNGKRVSGFKPDLFDSRIINSPTHIRIDGKDFIIVQLENNDLKILDRRGRDRIKIDEKIQFSENSIFSYLKTFTTTDNLGNLIQINMDGELLKKNLNLSIDNLIDIKNDNLVYISENNLSIKGINVKLPFGRYSKPKIFNESGNMLIGITNLDESNIYLYQDNGELLDGFPVKGNSIIDVKNSDKDDEIEILTRLDKYSIVSYEIN
ncbi:MAG: ribonuclease HII, partial [Cryomorphaceae bacterium]|nr:ribonuclease HII [Cryomorphaceae bacterium]